MTDTNPVGQASLPAALLRKQKTGKQGWVCDMVVKLKPGAPPGYRSCGMFAKESPEGVKRTLFLYIHGLIL